VTCRSGRTATTGRTRSGRRRKTPWLERCSHRAWLTESSLPPCLGLAPRGALIGLAIELPAVSLCPAPNLICSRRTGGAWPLARRAGAAAAWRWKRPAVRRNGLESRPLSEYIRMSIFVSLVVCPTFFKNLAPLLGGFSLSISLRHWSLALSCAASCLAVSTSWVLAAHRGEENQRERERDGKRKMSQEPEDPGEVPP
jgi:hypothetical protein